MNLGKSSFIRYNLFLSMLCETGPCSAYDAIQQIVSIFRIIVLLSCQKIQ